MNLTVGGRIDIESIIHEVHSPMRPPRYSIVL